MTEEEVIALLGRPNFELPLPEEQPGKAWYYRLLTQAARDEKSQIGSNKLFWAAGRVRCVLKDGKVVHLAGLWPKPTRPPARTPKEKIMLVDVAKIYDGIALTKEFNGAIRKRDAAATAKVEQMNREGNALLDEYRKAEKALTAPGLAAEEKQALASKQEKLLAEIHAKENEIRNYISTMKARFQEDVARRIDVCLPAIADAILMFKAEHDYHFVYETPENILAAGTKPLFVSGTNVTEAVIRWIDDGNAKRAGL